MDELNTLSGQRLRRELSHWCEVNASGSVYLLLDPNHPVPEDHELSWAQLRTREVPPLIEPIQRPDLAGHAELLPLLVSVRTPESAGFVDEALLDSALECALQRCRSVNGAYVAGWLCTTESVDQVARHLAAGGVLFDLGRGKRRFLPLFEPHRLALVADDDASQEFLSRWLGPVAQWLFVDANGQLRHVRANTAVACSSGASLGREAFAAQGRVHDARFVLLALDRAAAVPTHAPERAINAVMARAGQAGLGHVEDVVFYCLNHFTLGQGWAEHPKARALIASSAAHAEQRLAAAMQALPDGTLDEIAAFGTPG